MKNSRFYAIWWQASLLKVLDTLIMIEAKPTTKKEKLCRKYIWWIEEESLGIEEEKSWFQIKKRGKAKLMWNVGACHVGNQWYDQTRYVSPNRKIFDKKTTQN